MKQIRSLTRDRLEETMFVGNKRQIRNNVGLLKETGLKQSRSLTRDRLEETMYVCNKRQIRNNVPVQSVIRKIIETV